MSIAVVSSSPSRSWRAGHQNREFVAADARDAARLFDRLAQHLAGAAQQFVARGVAGLIVGGFQAVDVEDENGDRRRTLALEAIEFVDKEGAIVELGEDVVLAEELEIGLGLLAGGDVGQRDLDQRPVFFAAGEHRKLQMKMQRRAIERIVHHFALLEELSVPQVDQLFAERLQHRVAKDVAQAVEQRLLVGGSKQASACDC